jgi:hypothetical protein
MSSSFFFQDAVSGGEGVRSCGSPVTCARRTDASLSAGQGGVDRDTRRGRENTALLVLEAGDQMEHACCVHHQQPKGVGISMCG